MEEGRRMSAAVGAARDRRERMENFMVASCGINNQESAIYFGIINNENKV